MSYIFHKILGFLEIRGLIALALGIALIASLTVNASLDSKLTSLTEEHRVCQATVASYQSVVTKDVTEAKTQQTECASLVAEQVTKALEATPAEKNSEKVFNIKDFIK